MNGLEKMKASARPWHRRVAMVADQQKGFFDGVSQVLREYAGKLILIGDKGKISQSLSEYHITTSRVEVIDIATDYRTKLVISNLHTFLPSSVKIADYYQFLQEHPYMYGMIMAKLGLIDVLITPKQIPYDEFAAVAKSIVGCKDSVKTVTSTHMMGTHTDYGQDGVLFFSDCEIIKNPTHEQLADIAIATTELAEKIFGSKKAKTSLLSFSTKGSAKDPLVDKVVKAGQEIERRRCRFHFDYELQLDASIEVSVGQRKAPKSDVAGYANVLIYPDLQAANIGRQLVSSFGDAKTVGPILLGLRIPIYQLPECYTGEDLFLLTTVGIISSTL